MTWTKLSTQSMPNWLAAGVVLALHASLLWVLWGMSQAQQPSQRMDFGSPLMVRFVQAPPAPKPIAPPPAPEVKPVPKVKPVPEPEPKPQPRVERPPERVKPVEKPLIAQTRPKPVPMKTAPPAPKPPPRLDPKPKPSPPAVSAERPPQPPRSAPAAQEAKEAPITPPNIMAAYQDNTPPVYPMRSRRLGEEGEVLLRVHISSSGRVDQIKVQRSCGHKRLDHAALKAVRDWRFAPARQGERPVAAWVLVPIQFELS